MPQTFVSLPPDWSMRWVRALYYSVGFDLTFPGKDVIASRVFNWELEQGKGDSPKPQAAWDAQYASGEWDYMATLDEVPRYATIVGYLSYLAGQGAVLDVGCGDGVLYERYRVYDARYTGIDLSSAAIQRILRRYPEADVQCADANTFVPSEKYDAIVFNETLYYLQSPAETVARYTGYLTPHGVIIVSLYTASRRARAITRQLRSRFHVVDCATTSQQKHSWICLILRRTPGQ